MGKFLDKNLHFLFFIPFILGCVLGIYKLFTASEVPILYAFCCMFVGILISALLLFIFVLIFLHIDKKNKNK